MTRFLLLLFIASVLLIPMQSFAQPQGENNQDQTGGSSFLRNPLGGVETIDQLLGKVLDAVIAIGTVIVTIMIVYSGFLFVMAQGNPEGLSKAKSALLWTIIGGFLVLGARVVQEIITSTVKGLGGT